MTENDRKVAHALNELMRYRAIGTVSEFKDLKTREHNYDNCHNYTCRKRCEKDGYAKAIDEFAEKLMTDVESFVAVVNGIRADLLTLDYFCEFVDEVAEQMKGGAE